MVLPGEAEELGAEVSTDPETLAIVQEVVEAAEAELTEGAPPAPEAFRPPALPPCRRRPHGAGRPRGR